MRKLRRIFRNLPELIYPELMNLPEDVRRQVLKGGTRRSGILPGRYWGIITVMMLVLFGAVFYSQVYLPTGGTLEDVINSLGLAYCLIIFSTIMLLIKRAHKCWLHGELNRLRVRPLRCLPCGYDLRGTPDESISCPECGAEIASIIGESQDKLASEGLADPPAEPEAEGGDG